jgi:regulator of protease activity HflC (stomatin/prohibitin superfamily)
MSMSEETADLLPGAPLSRAVLMTRRLVWLYGVYAALGGLMLVLAAFPIPRFQKLDGLGHEFLVGGMGVAAMNAVLMALTASSAVALLTNSRLALRRAEAARSAGELDAGPPSLFALPWRLGPGVLAKQGQAVLLPLGGLIIALLAWRLWPSLPAPGVVAANANLVAAGVIGLAFPSLIVERMISGVPASQMPEAPGLRRLLLLTTLIMAVAGVAEIGRSIGISWTGWVQRGLTVVTLLLMAELALRALGRLFLPTPPFETAKAATDSILAALLTGGARAPGALIKTHLGLDFARSWALSYLAKAAIPALVATVLLCWGLSGVKLLGGDQRGIYERLGAPVKVLGPGFHVLMPWPLGRMRPVEYGTVHTISVGAQQGPQAFEKEQATEKAGAEDIPPPAMNRLWETAHATEAEYLVANQSGAGLQSFQVVNAEILVFYRTGMTDAAAYQSVYGSADPATVVEQEADRLATRYFASHTLEGVIGGQRDALQETLRADLAKAVDADKAGIDIVAILIDAIHPPAGAAAAYHAVQAAQITADASVFQATAHATRTAGIAQQEAHQATTAAEGGAVEKLEAAGGDAYQFAADRNAYRASPPAFLLERRARNLVQALHGARLMVVDHNLKGNQAPLVDLRVQSSAGDPAADLVLPTTPAYVPPPLPSTSTEGPPPPATSEYAAEQAVKSRNAARTPRNP